MKKIVVTGATSMIGVALIESAVENGVEVYTIVRPNSTRINRLSTSPLIHIIAGDLTDISHIEGIPADCDVFYHFAWMGTNKSERDDPIIQERNVKYTLDAVDLANRCGCSKFIGAGSQAEYGPTDGVIDDSTRFFPEIAYGVAKLAAGRLSRKLCDKYGMVHIWGRIFSVYGPHDNEWTMLNYAINQFSKKKSASFSSGTQMWNYLYESDAGMMFFLLGEKITESTEYRIAGALSQPLRKYIEEVSNIMNCENLCVFSPLDKQSKVYGIETCDSRLFNDIDYTPKTAFSDGIKKTIENYSSVDL